MKAAVVEKDGVEKSKINNYAFLHQKVAMEIE